MSVVRFDIGNALRSPRKLANGFCEYDCFATRSGVFTYSNKDGSQRREYRPPSEVSRVDSLQSLAGVPVTDNHPPKLLDTTTASQYSRGAVSPSPRFDGERVSTSFVVHDASLESKMRQGKNQISLGYRCDIEETPGITDEGERYDSIQRNIVYNHLAIVQKGRAGEGIRARMDADDAYTEHQEYMKIRIDGVEYEVSDQVAQAIDKSVADHKSAIDKLSARADAAEDKAKKAQERLDAVEDPKRTRELVNARVALEVKAAKYLGEEKFDSLSNRELQDKIAIKLGVSAEALKGKSDDYAKARFDAVIEDRESRNDGLENARAAVNTVQTRNDTNEDAEQKATRKLREDSANAWKVNN